MLLRGIITALVLVASTAMWYGLVAIPQGLLFAVELFSRSGSSRTPWMTVADLWLLVTMVMTLALAHATWNDSNHLSDVSILWSGSFLLLVALSGASYGFWALGLTAVGVIGVTFAAVQWLRIRTNADTLRG